MIILKKKLKNGLISLFIDSLLNNLKEVLYLMDLKLVQSLLVHAEIGECLLMHHLIPLNKLLKFKLFNLSYLFNN